MKKIDEMAIGGMNTIGSGAIDAAGPGDTPPVGGKAFEKMRKCARKHKKYKHKKKKKHVKESTLTGTLADVGLTALDVSSGRKPTSVPSVGGGKKAERVMKAARKTADEKRPVDPHGGDSHGNAYKQRLNAKPSTRAGSSDAEKMKYIAARLTKGSQVDRDKNRNRKTIERVRGNQTAIVGKDLDKNQSRIVRQTANFSPSNAKGSDVDGTENSGVIITNIDGKPRRSYLKTKPGVK